MSKNCFFVSQMLPSSSSETKTPTERTTTEDDDGDENDVEEKTTKKKRANEEEKNQKSRCLCVVLASDRGALLPIFKRVRRRCLRFTPPEEGERGARKDFGVFKRHQHQHQRRTDETVLDANERREKKSDFLHFEKKTKILREVTDACKEILSNQEVYSQGGRQKVAVKALECLFLVMNFVEKEKVRVSGTGRGATENVEMMMTCSATMLRDVCKAVAFCGKDDSSLEITRMVVKMLLALATSEHIVNSGIFQGEEGEEALEILTLRLAHSAVASDGDVERRVAKTALVQHINNCFKRCSEGSFVARALREISILMVIVFLATNQR